MTEIYCRFFFIVLIAVESMFYFAGSHIYFYVLDSRTVYKTTLYLAGSVMQVVLWFYMVFNYFKLQKLESEASND